MKTPTIGDEVRFFAQTGYIKPAIITDVDGDKVTLNVFRDQESLNVFANADEGITSETQASSERTAKMGDWFYPAETKVLAKGAK